MQIVNNKIYIMRGETATYDVNIIDRDTGAPFMIPKRPADYGNDFVIDFTVRRSVYNKDEDYALKFDFVLSDDIPQFNSSVVREYLDENWDDDYFNDSDADHTLPRDSEGNAQRVLYRRKLAKNVYDYAYFEETSHSSSGSVGEWVDYNSFRLVFEFPYESINSLDSKTYWYEISLFGGILKDNYANNEFPLQVVDYKKPILAPEEFIVGGTVSE